MISTLQKTSAALTISLALSAATHAHAVPINASATGLTNPARTITFSEHTFANSTAITNQFSDLGATFSNVYYDTTNSFPNITSPALNNFGNGSPVGPFSITFNQVQSGAAFAMITNTGTSNFAALLNGTVVESFSATTNTTNTNNFYGFTGIAFNQIQVAPGGGNTAMVLDNLQTAPVPEPSTYAMMALGVGALGLMTWKRKRSETQNSDFVSVAI